VSIASELTQQRTFNVSLTVSVTLYKYIQEIKLQTNVLLFSLLEFRERELGARSKVGATRS